MSNSDLLFEQVRQSPTDLTLLGAYADCLEEEGRTNRAAMVRELADKTQQMLEKEMLWTTLSSWQEREKINAPVMRLRQLLGMLPVRVGTWMSLDEDGRAVPTWNGDRNYRLGQVLHVEQGRCVVQVGNGEMYFQTHDPRTDD